MKKILASLALLAVSAFADYTVFKTTTGDSTVGGEEIYFGTLKDYQKKRSEVLSAVAAGSLQGLEGASASMAKGLVGESLKAGLAGAGMGLVIGQFSKFMDDTFYSDQHYILLRKNGNDLIAVYFVGDKHPELSEEQIHTILRNK